MKKNTSMMIEKMVGKAWFDDMASLVNQYLESYDNDIDIIAQVMEDSTYITDYSHANEIFLRMVNDIGIVAIYEVADKYGVDDFEDDVQLVNAMFLYVGEIIMNKIER